MHVKWHQHFLSDGYEVHFVLTMFDHVSTSYACRAVLCFAGN